MSKTRTKIAVFLTIAILYWLVAVIMKFNPSKILLSLAFISIISSGLALSNSITLIKKEKSLGVISLLFSAALLLAALVSFILEFLIQFF